jgi:hypothetical protein
MPSRKFSSIQATVRQIHESLQSYNYDRDQVKEPKRAKNRISNK